MVYRPGITVAEIARTLEAPKGSIHGFIRGLLAKVGCTSRTIACISGQPSTA